MCSERCIARAVHAEPTTNNNNNNNNITFIKPVSVTQKIHSLHHHVLKYMLGSTAAAVSFDRICFYLQQQPNLYHYDENHAFADITVPFYLYSGGDFDIFWNSCKKRIFAKGIEVSFLLHLQNHPWRVHTPETAALFVIPGLFSVALNSHFNESNCDLSVEEMSVTLATAVESSPWFKRYQG